MTAVTPPLWHIRPPHLAVYRCTPACQYILLRGAIADTERAVADTERAVGSVACSNKLLRYICLCIDLHAAR
jgi:hypothetical protein